jgi:Inhibitor of Apoptosis domain/Zinc finger, C3HC4 type (RING finger)
MSDPVGGDSLTLSSEVVSLRQSSFDESVLRFFRELRSEQARLHSFRYSNRPHAEGEVKGLSEDGFFYLPSLNQIQCAFCRIIVDWHPENDPRGTHRLQNETCPLLAGMNVGNITLENQSSFNLKRLEKDEIVFYSKRQKQEVKQEMTWMQQFGVKKHKGPKHEKYVMYETRLKSFNSKWPKDAAMKPEKLAQAGFFHTGQDDIVKCFHCNASLGDWEQGMCSWTEHAKWYPYCNFLMLNKSPAFIKSCSLPDKYFKMNFPNEKVRASAGIQVESWKRSAYVFEVNRQFPISKILLEYVLYQRWAEKQMFFESYEEFLTAISESSHDRILWAEHPSHLIDSTEPKPNNETQNEIISIDHTLIDSEAVNYDILCKICFTNNLEIMFLPCGHLTTCSMCAPGVKDLCPICRSKIKGCVKSYF